ncbi:dTMP kinase [bacterium]|nr:dTMP kinase [bacterium]
MHDSLNGLFITFEGIDGCGKSLQAERLAGRLQKKGVLVHLFRDPGGPPISEKVRLILLDRSHGDMSAMTELLLYESARAQLIDEWIRPALDRGDTVLCDRFTDSTVAYQGYGRGLKLDLLQRANDLACRGITPGRTFFLDIPVEESLRRMAGMNKQADRMENQTREFFERVRRGYREIADSEPRRIRILDGTKSADELEQVIFQDVYSMID